MKLWIGNLPPGVGDEELVEFLHKYGCPRPAEIQRVPGDGSRPAAILKFEAHADEQIAAAQTRLHGMYWQERELVVQTILH